MATGKAWRMRWIAVEFFLAALVLWAAASWSLWEAWEYGRATGVSALDQGRGVLMGAAILAGMVGTTLWELAPVRVAAQCSNPRCGHGWTSHAPTRTRSVRLLCTHGSCTCNAFVQRQATGGR